MTDNTTKLSQPNWGRDRGKNTRRNRSQYHERIEVDGYTRSDGVHVKGYRRRPPIRGG
jgi:hypothetical protein